MLPSSQTPFLGVFNICQAPFLPQWNLGYKILTYSQVHIEAPPTKQHFLPLHPCHHSPLGKGTIWQDRLHARPGGAHHLTPFEKCLFSFSAWNTPRCLSTFSSLMCLPKKGPGTCKYFNLSFLSWSQRQGAVRSFHFPHRVGVSMIWKQLYLLSSRLEQLECSVLTRELAWLPKALLGTNPNTPQTCNSHWKEPEPVSNQTLTLGTGQDFAWYGLHGWSNFREGSKGQIFWWLWTKMEWYKDRLYPSTMWNGFTVFFQKSQKTWNRTGCQIHLWFISKQEYFL